jgi:lipopolysaccharide export system protein LptC
MTFATRVRYWLPLLPLIGLLGAAYWLNKQAQPEPAQPDGSTRHDPDSIVENFSAVKLNKEGSPHFIMRARKMLHYPDDDSTSLESPQIALLAEGRPPLHATAETGSITKKGEQLLLQGGVEVLRGSRAPDQVRLQTESLRIIPDQDLATSDETVTVRDAHATVNAVGLEINNRTRTIKLFSKVKSEYVPPVK